MLSLKVHHWIVPAPEAPREEEEEGPRRQGECELHLWADTALTADRSFVVDVRADPQQPQKQRNEETFSMTLPAGVLAPRFKMHRLRTSAHEGGERWERDDYVRRVPAPAPQFVPASDTLLSPAFFSAPAPTIRSPSPVSLADWQPQQQQPPLQPPKSPAFQFPRAATPFPAPQQQQQLQASTSAAEAQPLRQQHVWVFDYSSRVLTEDPGIGVVPPPPAGVIIVRAVGRTFAGGSLFAWHVSRCTGTLDEESFSVVAQGTLEEEGGDGCWVTRYEVPFKPWMLEYGFHFKLRSRDGHDECDRATKLWVPSDGARVWCKSGQPQVRRCIPHISSNSTGSFQESRETAPWRPVIHRFNVLHGRQCGGTLEIADDSEADSGPEVTQGEEPAVATAPKGGSSHKGFRASLSPRKTSFGPDPDAAISAYEVALFPGAQYVVWAPQPAGHARPICITACERQSKSPQGDTVQPTCWIIKDAVGTFSAPPERTREVIVFVRSLSRRVPEFDSTGPALRLTAGPPPLQWAQGRTYNVLQRAPTAWEPITRCWFGMLRVFGPEVGHHAIELSFDVEGEPQRMTPGVMLRPIPAGATQLTTIEGIPGVVIGRPSPAFDPLCDIAEADHINAHAHHQESGSSRRQTSWRSSSNSALQSERAKRKELLAAQFGWECVNHSEGGMFTHGELPLGATLGPSGATWFVLNAPHSVRVHLLLESSPHERSELRLTRDMRYWWCCVQQEKACAGAKYRFVLDEHFETLDPASREVSADGLWSVVVDTAALRGIAMQGCSWRTPDWNKLSIYQLHALRFSHSKDGLAPPAFLRVAESLEADDGYLRKLPVSAVELLPVHEVAEDSAWSDHSPALLFAIRRAYGGPAGLANLARAAHASGKALLLASVFSHVADSAPLRFVAGDSCFQGRTPWGDLARSGSHEWTEHVKQCAMWFYRAFCIDGIRLESTEAIVCASRGAESPTTRFVVAWDRLARAPVLGAPFGEATLHTVREALHAAASACDQPWPIVVIENDPNLWRLTGDACDAQWDFACASALSAISRPAPDPQISAHTLAGALAAGQHSARVCFVESHDTCSCRIPGWLTRIAARVQHSGMCLAKALGAIVILAPYTIPMLFMGQETAETRCFLGDFNETRQDVYDRERFYVDPKVSVQTSCDAERVHEWYSDLLSLRNTHWERPRQDAPAAIGTGNCTIGFGVGSSARLFVVATWGTPDRVQALGKFLGMPQGAQFRCRMHSESLPYRTTQDNVAADAAKQPPLSVEGNQIFDSTSLVELPYIGAVVFERV